MNKRHLLDIISYRVYADLKAEAARGYLGYLWWVLEPAIFLGAFYLIFGVILNRGGVDFVSFLLIGLVTWKWFAGGISASMSSINANRGLISQVYLPKQIFPLISVMTVSVKFVVTFTLLCLFVLLMHGVSLEWLFLPLVVGLQAYLIVSLALAASALVPLVPDFKIIIDNALLLLFFLSGVFFDIGSLPDEYMFFIELNPMAVVIKLYRDSFLYGGNWDFGGAIYVFSLSSFFLIFGLWLIRKFDYEYSKRL